MNNPAPPVKKKPVAKKTIQGDLPAPSKGIHFIQMVVGVLFILNLLSFYGIFLSSRGIIGYRQKHLQVKEAEERNERIKAKNHHLFQKIKNSKTDMHAQERLVREQLGWVKKGEVVIEFMPRDQKKQ